MCALRTSRDLTIELRSPKTPTARHRKPTDLIWISAPEEAGHYSDTNQRRCPPWKRRASTARHPRDARMIRVVTFLIGFLLAATSFVTPSGGVGATNVASSTHEAHHAHDSHDTVVAPPEGKLWPTDEPLRIGMSRIETAVAQANAAKRPISRKRARALARTVEGTITYLIEHCQLPPEPDAALHMLIARMMTAANQLDHETSTEAAITQLVNTLHDYRGTFHHSSAPSPHGQ